MQKLTTFFFFYQALLIVINASMFQERVNAGSEYVPGELIIKLTHAVEPDVKDDGTILFGIFAVDGLNVRYGLTGSRRLFQSSSLSKIYLLDFNNRTDMEKIALEYSRISSVEYAEPNYYAGIASSWGSRTDPDDQYFDQQWGLHNEGQTGGTADADIDAPEAWEIETGTSNIVIAMIDTGIDLDHEDLANNIWVNDDEIPDNETDDDGNGFVDDMNGWDFVNSDSAPQDDNGHGTHTSGIAAAETNNNQGTAGVCWECRLMSVKTLGDDGNGTYSDIVEGVDYAANNGADVINLSLGSLTYSQSLQDAITAAHDAGCVIVGAAGNFDVEDPFYPAACENVIAVAALDHNDVKYQLSGYGEWVDLAAPGASIMSTAYHDAYSQWSGTSMAAPFVSGVAGLLFSYNSDWDNGSVEAQMLNTADSVDGHNPSYAGLLGNGRVNAYYCLSGSAEPALEFASFMIDDPYPGDEDGVLDPNETADLVVTLYNSWGDASSVQGTLSTTDSNVTVTSAVSDFGDVEALRYIDNGSDPFELALSDTCPPGHEINLNLHAQDSASNEWDFDIILTAGSWEYPVPTFINTDTTWEENAAYLISGNVLVTDGAVLTIEPGVTVKLGENSNIYFRNDARLVAGGSETQPITFTSINPPTEWGALELEDTCSQQNEMRFCRFFYATKAVNDNSGKTVFENNIVQDSSSSLSLMTNYFSGNELNNVEGGVAIDVYFKNWNPDESIIENNLITNGGGLSCSINDANEDSYIDDLEINGNMLHDITGDGIFIYHNGNCHYSCVVQDSTIENCSGTGIAFSDDSSNTVESPIARYNFVKCCETAIDSFYKAEYNHIEECYYGVIDSLNIKVNNIIACNKGISESFRKRNASNEGKIRRNERGIQRERSRTSDKGILRVPQDFEFIQAAVDAAITGDTVLVADGTYTGIGNKNIDFTGTAITVMSENGPDNCVIDCEDDGRGFYFHSGETQNSVVDGFTIENGSVAGDGGGIYCSYISSPIIRNSIITGNISWEGYGGGIYCGAEYTSIIEECTISENTAQRGGGIYGDGVSFNVTGCEIYGNYANVIGGGIICPDGSNAAISNSNIYQNSAQKHSVTCRGGGGIACFKANDVSINRCNIYENSSLGSGSGVLLYDCNSADITDTVFTANYSAYDECPGAAIGCLNTNPSIADCIFEGNWNYSSGGCAYCKSASPAMTNCVISYNSAGSDGGAGIYCDGQSSPTVINCSIYGNSTNEGYGGAIQCTEYSSLTSFCP